jgi:hypothetical protein
VTELIEGDSPKGPMPIKEAIAIARQVADALGAAHEKNVIHGDLRLGNIRVAPDGVVKVLDFGRGKGADKRADIRSFGIVLLELLTGPLQGEPDLDRLPATTPPAVRELVRRCLDRSSKTGLRDIDEAREVLNSPTLFNPPAPKKRPMPAWPWAAAFFVTLIGANGAWWFATRPREPRTPMRFDVEISRDLAISRTTPMAISPDGTRLVVRLQDADGVTRLYTRLLAHDQLAALPGTENAAAPFFSPDGNWIGFAAGGTLQKVAVAGGAPIKLCDAPNAIQGASWGDDDDIVFVGPSRNLMRVPSAGGTPSELTRAEDAHATPKWPQVLPRSKVVVYTADRGSVSSTIEAFSIEHNRTKTVQKDAFSGRFLPTPDGGRLLYIQHDTLFAAPFDWERLSLAGTPAAVVHGIGSSADGGGEYAVSKTGTLVFLPLADVQSAKPPTHLTFVLNFVP